MAPVAKLTIWTITLMLLAVAAATEVLAQEKLVFDVSAENTKYTQQYTIDVGDVSGHQVRILEIHRVYPSEAPMINGIKIIESWTRGTSDY